MSEVISIGGSSPYVGVGASQPSSNSSAVDAIADMYGLGSPALGTPAGVQTVAGAQVIATPAPGVVTAGGYPGTAPQYGYVPATQYTLPPVGANNGEARTIAPTTVGSPTGAATTSPDAAAAATVTPAAGGPTPATPKPGAKPAAAAPKPEPKPEAAKPEPKPDAKPAPVADAKPGPVKVTVKAGDSLSKIAAAHGVKWQEIYADGANKKVVGANPDLIRPGQELIIPGKAQPAAPAKPAEPKPAEPKPAEAKADVPKPADAKPADAEPATAAPGGPAAAAGVAAPTKAEMQAQLADVEKKYEEGSKLIKQSYVQLQQATSVEAQGTISASIDQLNTYNKQLDQIRKYLREQLGLTNQPVTDPLDLFLNQGLGL